MFKNFEIINIEDKGEIMTGIFLSVLVAFLDAGKSIFVKKNVQKTSGIITAWSWQISSLLVMGIALLITGIPTLTNMFWVWAGIKTVLAVIALLLYTNSLKETDLTLALPMLTLTPLVTTIMSLLLSGEFPSPMGLVGILVIVLGLYLLNTEKGKGLLEPFKAIFSNKGVVAMLAVAIVWGISTSVDKEGVLSSSPIAYSAITTVLTALALTPAVFIKHKNDIKSVFSKINAAGLTAGILDGFLVLAQMTAVTLTLAAYVISIKRSSIVISAVIAHFVFGEELKGRLIPILIMLGGLILIIFS